MARMIKALFIGAQDAGSRPTGSVFSTLNLNVLNECGLHFKSHAAGYG